MKSLRKIAFLGLGLVFVAAVFSFRHGSAVKAQTGSGSAPLTVPINVISSFSTEINPSITLHYVLETSHDGTEQTLPAIPAGTVINGISFQGQTTPNLHISVALGNPTSGAVCIPTYVAANADTNGILNSYVLLPRSVVLEEPAVPVITVTVPPTATISTSSSNPPIVTYDGFNWNLNPIPTFLTGLAGCGK